MEYFCGETSNHLQVLQNKCIRIISGWKQKQQLYPLLQKYDMLTVDQIFSFEIAKFMFQLKSRKVAFDNYFNLIKDASNYAIRSAIKNNFCLPLYKTRRGQKSIYSYSKNIRLKPLQHVSP